MTERETVGVEDRGYVVLSPDEPYTCTKRGCSQPAVAYFLRGVSYWNRTPPEHRTRRWYCCPDHLYGRRLVDGKVLHDVAIDSPAAKRGYIE